MKKLILALLACACGNPPAPAVSSPTKQTNPVEQAEPVEQAPFPSADEMGSGWTCRSSYRVYTRELKIQRSRSDVRIDIRGHDVRSPDRLVVLKPTSDDLELPALFTKPDVGGLRLQFNARDCTFRARGVYYCLGQAAVRYLDRDSTPLGSELTRRIELSGIRMRRSTVEQDSDHFETRVALVDEETPTVWTTTGVFDECRGDKQTAVDRP